MRKIVNSTYLTLDGVVENPQDWPPSSDVDDPAGGEIQHELLFGADALVMGRHTYDGFAPVWPTRTGDPFSDRINSMPKYVVSSTLRDPEWTNTTVISGDDAVAEIRRLKEQPGKNLLQYGFGRLTATMLENDLLDELTLWVYPLLLGRGEPSDLLFRESRPARLELADCRPLKTGTVVLTYRARR